jgi:hypothetical protein
MGVEARRFGRQPEISVDPSRSESAGPLQTSRHDLGFGFAVRGKR